MKAFSSVSKKETRGLYIQTVRSTWIYRNVFILAIGIGVHWNVHA